MNFYQQESPMSSNALYQILISIQNEINDCKLKNSIKNGIDTKFLLKMLLTQNFPPMFWKLHKQSLNVNVFLTKVFNRKIKLSYLFRAPKITLNLLRSLFCPVFMCQCFKNTAVSVFI